MEHKGPIMGPFQICPLKGCVTANQYVIILTDVLFLVIKCIHPDEGGLLQDDSAAIRTILPLYTVYEESINDFLRMKIM